MTRAEMTIEEAIKYAEALKEKEQARIEFYRRGHAHAPEVCYSDLAFLSATISALREQEERRWIPVTERLPEDSTYVLARLSGGAIYQALCLTKGSKQWYSANHERFVNKDTVTHWMPLPKPPIGE